MGWGGGGGVAISTFAEFKDLSPSRVLEVDLACKFWLMTCSWARLCINTCIWMCQSTCNTIIDVKNDFWRGMFTIKPAKSSWTCRQPCLDFLLMCGCSDFALHNFMSHKNLWNVFRFLLQYDSLNNLPDFTLPIQYRRGSRKKEKKKKAKWKYAFQIYYTADHWVDEMSATLKINLLFTHAKELRSTTQI